MSAINTTDDTSNFNHSNGLSLLEEQHSNIRTVSGWILTFSIALVITICVLVLKFIHWRCTYWRKFHERGCSYDITTYLIIKNELDIKFDKETIQKGIQKQVDRRIYDVTSRYYENIVRHDQFKGKNINIQHTNEMHKNFSKHPGILYAVHGLSTRTHIHKNLMVNKKRDSDTNRDNIEKGYSESDKSNDESVDDITSFSDANSEKPLCNNHSVTNIHPQTNRQNRVHKTSASGPCDTEIQTRHSSKQVSYHKIK